MTEVRGPGGEWRPIVTIDVVLLTILSGSLHAAVIKRTAEPHAGMSALPGGYLRPEEDSSIEAAALRVLRDKAGLPALHLEQLKVFSGPTRDPRGWSISCAFLALVPHDRLPDPDGRYELVTTKELDEPGRLAFDHQEILQAAIARLRGKGNYSTLPAALVADEFTLTELRTAYEIAFGNQINRTDFRRKILSLDAIEETGAQRKADGPARPALTYRLKDGVRVFDRNLNWQDG